MEPENHPFGKENHLQTLHFRFHVSFCGGVPIFVKNGIYPQFYHTKNCRDSNLQELQVPKMEESCTLFQAILGVGVPLHKALHTAYIGEDSYIHVRYLKFILAYRRSILLQTRHPSCAFIFRHRSGLTLLSELLIQHPDVVPLNKNQKLVAWQSYNQQLKIDVPPTLLYTNHSNWCANNENYWHTKNMLER